MLSRSTLFVQDEENSRDYLSEKEIRYCRDQLAVRPSGHPQRANACASLAYSLYQRVRERYSPELLDEVIALERELLTLQPHGHPDRADSCNNLKVALLDRYLRCGSSALLDEIIALERELLNLQPNGHPDRAHSCSNLAVALLDRYRRTGSYALLEEIIKLLREALALQPAEHPDHAVLCNNLAAALLDCYEATGSSALLDEAIKMHREALALRPAEHPDRAVSCDNLADALLNHYRVTGTTTLLEEIIMLHREALALQPTGHPGRAMSCSSLADALLARYEATDSPALLDEVIKLHREALALRPVGHPDRARSCNNLANALASRYRMTGTTTLLGDMIILHREALALQPPEHPNRAHSCNNLANALILLYKATGSSAPIDEIIRLYREALALQPAEHPDRAMACNNLANALAGRYQRTGGSALLNEAIKLHREALALQPAGHPDRAMSCNNLAHSLWQYFGETQDVIVIDETLELARESAMSFLPSKSWFALLLLCSIHLDQRSAHFSISTATEYLSQASVSLPDDITEFMYTIQPRLDQVWLMHGAWTPDTTLLLLDVYSNIIDRLSRMTGFAFDPISQLTALKSARSFGSDACVVAVLLGCPSQAIEQIDHAHGVIWAQALHQRDPQLQDIPRSLASELQALLRAVSMPMTRQALTAFDPATLYLSPEDIRNQQNSRIQAILTEVRAIPGLERFMLGRTYAQLRETAREHPVVVLVAARGHVYALIIPNAVNENPDMLPLEITSDGLALLRDTAARAGLRNGNVVQDIETDPEHAMGPGNFYATPLGTLANLWHEITKPVIDHLHLPRATGRTKSRLHWCPTGDFAFLPIHAAGIYTGPEESRVCCSDYVVSSYTPTLSALLNAQNKAPRTAPAPLNMLIVAEDGSGPESTVSPLSFVEPELTCVRDETEASRHGCSVELIAKHATIDRVTERIQTAHFVHLACHGTQHATKALESGFYLSNGKLTVASLMELNLDKAWFAYLSACETAKSDVTQPEQVVHLTAAMLHAGFKSVVATMWAMSDSDGLELARWFYQELLSNEVIDEDAVAYALDAAVEKLRKKIWLMPKRWAPYIHMGA